MPLISSRLGHYRPISTPKFFWPPTPVETPIHRVSVGTPIHRVSHPIHRIRGISQPIHRVSAK
jgi:hypothetical protein